MGDLVSTPGWEDPLEEGMATHSSILAWRIPIDRGAWRDAVHRVAKCWTQAAKHAQDIQVVLVIMNPPTNAGDTGDMGSILCWEDPLEEGMTTHSSILAWRIPIDGGAW